MDAAFYNHTKSYLDPSVEIYHAYVLSLFCDTVYLLCRNSSIYNLLKGSNEWNDRVLQALFSNFEQNNPGKFGMCSEDLNNMIRHISETKRIRNKSKIDFNLLQKGSQLKKTLKEVFEADLKDFLAVNRVFGLQSLIDKEVVKMWDMLSIYKDKNHNLYIREIRDIFMKYEEYQVFGMSALQIFKVLEVNNSQTINIPHLLEKEYDVMAFEFLQFPLLSELNPDQLHYLREQLYPEFDEFRKKADKFRDEIADIRFEPENFKQITKLFQERIGCLQTGLQHKIDEQLFIQFARNLLPEFGLKLLLVIAPVNKMIDYFHKTRIIPMEDCEAARRNLDREMDLNQCNLFFYVEISDKTLNSKKI